jgi:hypothetical protein
MKEMCVRQDIQEGVTLSNHSNWIALSWFAVWYISSAAVVRVCLISIQITHFNWLEIPRTGCARTTFQAHVHHRS